MQLPEERQVLVKKLRKLANDKLRKGFEETTYYNMPASALPHATYPDGYYYDPIIPLQFLNIALQNNFMAVYRTGCYAGVALIEWFKNEYPKHIKTKIDIGKSCIRFKKMKTIPYEPLGQFFSKVTVAAWIARYKSVIKKQ